MQCIFNVAKHRIHQFFCQMEFHLLLVGPKKPKFLTNFAPDLSWNLLRTTQESGTVMVKQLGQNPSQIDRIDIGHRKTDELKQDQTLYVVNMKYPHRIVCIGQQFPDEVPASKRAEKKKLNTESEGDKITLKRTKLSNSEEENMNESPKKEKSESRAEISSKREKNEPPSSKKPTHWSQGLKASTSDPEFQVYKDDKVTVIKDKYPKAKYHWLVMPVESITTTSQLRSKHVPLLKHMLQIGKKINEENVEEKDRKLKFRYGYHAVPSMSHLHMHVISQDFCSPALKTKKHWNSFTTSYFVDADVLISEVEEKGKVENRRHMTELLKSPLKCHICQEPQKNMPELKRHITHCS